MENVDNFDLVSLSAVDDPILTLDYLANIKAIEPFYDSPGSWEGCELITSLQYAVYELVRLLF